MESVLETTAHIISLGLGLVTGFFLYRCLCFFASRKESRLWLIPVLFSCAILSCMVIFSNDFFNVTLAFVWFIAMMLAAFRGKIIPRLAAVAVLYPLIISLNFLLRDILGYFYMFISNDLWSSITCTIAESTLQLLFWFFISRFFENRLSQISTLFNCKTWILLSIVCMASFVSIITCVYFTPQQSWKFWICALACIMTNIGCLYLAEYFINSIRSDMEIKNLELQGEYYRQLEQNQSDIRKFYHDINNHLDVVKSLLDAGDNTAAKDYFHEIEAQAAVRNRAFCSSGILNALLNSKYNSAEDSDIDCFFNIDLKDTMGIDDVSLCSLFANTLDNAIEASLKIPDESRRKISLKSRTTSNGYFSFELINAKINSINKKDGRFLSDKEESTSHGLGIPAVKSIVKKYGGTIDITYTDATFTVTIFIRI
ncbi:MAG: GHKL domain-containing protein [Clostridiales bacterium]|nr:GHKL domain-containing protein [Clostridiales bacterium]